MAKKEANSAESFVKLKKEITSGVCKPVYFLCGSETFYTDHCIDLFKNLLPEDQRDFNFDLLFGQDISVSKALSIAKSYPMMAERRVLIVRNALDMGANLSEKSDLNEILPFLKQPNPAGIFVMISENIPAANTKFGAAVKNHSNVGYFEFGPLPDAQLIRWISAYAQDKHKKHISIDAAALLADFVGNNLQLLSTEIDKVCTFVDNTDSVNEELIKKIIGSYREITVFELKDAILSRNLKKATDITERLLQQIQTNTGEMLRTVGFFQSVFVNIWQIRRLADAGQSPKQVQMALGIKNDFYFNRLWKDASAYRFSDMPRIFEALLDADRSIKGFSTLDPTAIFFLLVQRIIG